jgi:hypothetical protein
MKNKIEAFVLQNNMENEACFIRYALNKVLVPDVEDKELVFESLSQLHEKIRLVEEQQEIIFKFLNFQHRNLLAYLPEIPQELRGSAALSAKTRHGRFFDGFQEELKKSPPLFESLLADYFEEE